MSKKSYVRETYLSEILPYIGTDIIKVITGMRRTGKSTIMNQIIDMLVEKGTAVEDIQRYDFESGMTPYFKDSKGLYDYIRSKLPEGHHTYIFLDEIQNIDDWHICVRALHTDTDSDIFLTGSSSKMLSGEMATHLAGRYVEFRILPFSFSEVVGYYNTNGIPYDRTELFGQYVRYGGMPLIVAGTYDMTTSDSILSAMYDSVVINDIAGRKGIRNTNILKEVLLYAMSETGHIVNSSNVGNYLKSQGKRSSADSVLEYLSAAEDAMFLTKVPKKDLRGKELMKIDCKYYLTDWGIRGAEGLNNGASVDQILENIVYNELKYRGYKVTIGRMGEYEIDFVASKGKDIEYYQVSYLLASEPTTEREFRSLESIKDNYPKYVLSMDTIDRSRNGIHHLNLVDWLSAH